MWLGKERLQQPAPQFSAAVVGDREPAPIWPFGPFDRLESDLPALLEASKGRIDLRVSQRPIGREVRIEEPFQVVAMVRLLLEKPEQGVRYAHGGGLYTQCIAGVNAKLAT